MKCAQCQPRLAALAGGDLETAESRRCQDHVGSCAECARQLGELQATVALLRRVGPREPLPADFRAALHRRLAGEPPPGRPLLHRLWQLSEFVGLDSGRRLGLGLAATGLLALLLLSPRPRAGEGGAAVGVPEQEVAAAFRVPSRRVAVVQLDFVAEVPLEDVEFEVTLPSELHFVDGGQPLADRTLLWHGSLLTGRNPIPLAVSGVKPGRYRVTAQARSPGMQVRHDILLEVVPS